MMNFLYAVQNFFRAVGEGALIVLSTLSVFFFGEPVPPAVATSTPAAVIATTTPAVATTSVPVVTPPRPKPAPAPKPVPPAPKPPVVLPPPSTSVGPTTIVVQNIPLLSGGVVHAGQTVPISYLQVTNTGTDGARLTGFHITQQGSAPDAAVIGLSTVDDLGGSRGSVGGNEAAIVFDDGEAIAPTDAYIGAGRTRLFTIKATLSHQVADYSGETLMLVVSSVTTTATSRGEFPIRGTTWTIAP